MLGLKTNRTGQRSTQFIETERELHRELPLKYLTENWNIPKFKKAQKQSIPEVELRTQPCLYSRYDLSFWLDLWKLTQLHVTTDHPTYYCFHPLCMWLAIPPQCKWVLAFNLKLWEFICTSVIWLCYFLLSKILPCKFLELHLCEFYFCQFMSAYLQC